MYITPQWEDYTVLLLSPLCESIMSKLFIITIKPIKVLSHQFPIMKGEMPWQAISDFQLGGLKFDALSRNTAIFLYSNAIVNVYHIRCCWPVTIGNLIRRRMVTQTRIFYPTNSVKELWGVASHLWGDSLTSHSLTPQLLCRRLTSFAFLLSPVSSKPWVLNEPSLGIQEKEGRREMREKNWVMNAATLLGHSLENAIRPINLLLFISVGVYHKNEPKCLSSCSMYKYFSQNVT